MAGILVIGEIQDGRISAVSGELLTAAGKLVDEGVSGGVSLAVMGDDLSAVTAAQAPGAERVIRMSDPALKESQDHGSPSSWAWLWHRTAST